MTALNLTQNERRKVTDYIFEKCVVFLHWIARKLGTSYEAVNVWVFCVIWPLFTLFLMGWIVWLLMHRHPAPENITIIR